MHLPSTVQQRAATYDAALEPGTPALAGSRIASIDFVRGVVMILMAIDHVRVFAGVPPGGPDPGVFFTRWVTHFVAPAFVFLAGTAAYLHGRKLGDRNELAKFLVSRGAFLILLELTVIRYFWTFNLDFANYMLAGVIWMLGWCMILLAAAVYLPVRVIAAIGVAIIALHNVTDFFRDRIGAAFGDAGPPWVLQFLYTGGAVRLGGESGPPLLVLYVLVPWIGVMMAGYAFGRVVELPSERRRGIMLRLGIAATLLFVALRAADVYGDPNPWRGVDWLPAAFAFLETTKYPASLAFLLMTLGPMLILLALAEGWRGRAVEAATVFGRVPMFYYLLHIPVIHVAAMIVSLVREGRMNPWLFGNHPLAPPEQPDGYRWSLWLLYLVFILCVIALYFPCRWYAGVRARRRSKWLSYL
ncbi:MAG TPA: heparan-alpha-glucosaminide N-acetyltransferase domain-containing protein [Gemmatimonadaceae bacterium]|nr:heparan-alpha-glucosaminide N-acetyltransferase domain-containing protein [Gemmatimonadaceae bacterium]